MVRSLLDIQSLPLDEFYEILKLAKAIALGDVPNLDRKFTVANMFYENSTRTLVSFELAAKRLGLYCTNVDISSSSEAKGEVFFDTLKTLASMSIDAFVIRHRQEKLLEAAQRELPHTHFINAGDGMNAHPSQALLDAFTIKQSFNDLSSTSATIVGDIRHSRVTNSLILALRNLGIKDIRLCAPSYFLPEKPLENVVIEPSVSRALEGANVVYALRVQKERFSPELDWSVDDYISEYCLTEARLACCAKDKIIMHPGPMNRGIEITSEVADSANSFILQQVKNGVFTRMAILDWIFK